MDPTLHDGERVIALKNTEIERFDIITFEAPDEEGKNYIKRVIGLPGIGLLIKTIPCTLMDKRMMNPIWMNSKRLSPMAFL